MKDTMSTNMIPWQDERLDSPQAGFQQLANVLGFENSSVEFIDDEAIIPSSLHLGYSSASVAATVATALARQHRFQCNDFNQHS